MVTDQTVCGRVRIADQLHRSDSDVRHFQRFDGGASEVELRQRLGITFAYPVTVAARGLSNQRGTEGYVAQRWDAVGAETPEDRGGPEERNEVSKGAGFFADEGGRPGGLGGSTGGHGGLGHETFGSRDNAVLAVVQRLSDVGSVAVFQVAQCQALRRTGECDAGLQLLGVLRANLRHARGVQGFDHGFADWLGRLCLRLLHGFQAGQVFVDRADFTFQGIEGFGLLRVQGRAVFAGFVHDGGHFSGFGDASCFELRNLFGNGFHV
ncbi:hypothetical protein D3C76_974730 [compost metagenome]